MAHKEGLKLAEEEETKPLNAVILIKRNGGIKIWQNTDHLEVKQTLNNSLPECERRGLKPLFIKQRESGKLA